MGAYVLTQAAVLDQRIRAVVLAAAPNDVVERIGSFVMPLASIRRGSQTFFVAACWTTCFEKFS
jgi:hypothetical protein